MNIFWSLILFSLITIVSPQCCNKFNGWKCQQCPEGTRLYKGHCLFNIPHCQSYIGGFNCQVCQQGYQLKNEQCQLIPRPVEKILDISNIPEEYELAYDASNQFFLSSHRQIRNATVVGAIYKIIPDEKDQVIIEYKINVIFYRGVMQVDVVTFAFKELQFKKIAKQTIFPPVKQRKKVKQESVDRTKYVEQRQKLEQLALKQNQNIDKPVGAKLISYDDQTKDLIIIYVGKDAKNYEVKGKIQADKSVILQSISQTSKTGSQDGYGDLRPEQVPKKQIKYVKTQLNSIKNDQNYLLMKDIITRTLDGYEQIQPTEVGTFEQDSTIYYEFFFIKIDGSEWRITSNINTQTFVLIIESQEQLKQATNKEQVFEDVELIFIYKDVNFIITREAIDKQLNGKYEKAQIISLKVSDKENQNKYVIRFILEGDEWQTIAIINKQSLQVIISDDTLIKSKPKEQVIVIDDPQTGNQTNNNQPKNNQTAKNETNQNNNQTNNQNQGTMTNKNDTKPENQTTPVKNQTTPPTQNNNQTKDQTTPPIKNDTKKNQTTTPPNNETITPPKTQIIPPKNQTTPPKNQTTPPKNETTAPKNQTTLPKNQTTPPVNETTPHNKEKIPPVNETTPSKEEKIPAPILNDTKKNETKEKQRDFDNDPLSSQIITATTGFKRQTKSKVDGDSIIQKVITLLVSVNQFELKQAELIAVFLKTQGFIQSYKIYHDNNGMLYEGQVTYDRLRRRSYIISFGKLGF